MFIAQAANEATPFVLFSQAKEETTTVERAWDPLWQAPPPPQWNHQLT